MGMKSPAVGQARSARPRWRGWLRFAALAATLLALSEALWLWQTWPVRELLQPPATGRPTGAQ